MKRKYTVAILSMLIIVVAAILLINKPSYAQGIPSSNYCPREITVTPTAEQLSLISGLSLPKYLNVKTTSGVELPNLALIGERNISVDGQKYIKSSEYPEVITKFSNDIYENRYYQQLFSWLLDDLRFNDNYNLSEEEKKMIEESEKGKILIDKLEELKRLYNWTETVEEEPVFTLDNIDTSNLTYHATNEYLETGLITPTSTAEYSYLFTHYEVKVSSPLKVVDENGNEKSEFERGEGFRLRIPKSEIKDNTIDFSARVIGKAKFDIWGSYYEQREEEPMANADSRIIAAQVVLVNCGEQEELGAFNPVYVNSNITVGNLNIKVIDAESKENLSNAEVVIYDEKGNEVYRYRTTGSELNITLPIGNYTVKQIVPPPNYQARVTEQKVSITENSYTTATIENVQLIEVPDTGKTISNIIIIGIIITLIGSAVILMTLKKTKEAK